MPKRKKTTKRAPRPKLRMERVQAMLTLFNIKDRYACESHLSENGLKLAILGPGDTLCYDYIGDNGGRSTTTAEIKAALRLRLKQITAEEQAK